MLEMFLYVLVGNYHRKNPRLNCVKGELTQFKVEVTILQEFTALKKTCLCGSSSFHRENDRGVNIS